MNIWNLIYPSRMYWYSVAGRVVAQACERSIERQSLLPEVNLFFHYICTPQALQSLIMQIVTKLTTREQGRPLLIKLLNFTNTIPHHFHTNAKIPTTGDKLHGGTRDVPMPSTLVRFSAIWQNPSISFALNSSGSLFWRSCWRCTF